MMLNKEQKAKFVDENRKEIKRYSVVGILPVNGIPDRLVQASRNKMRKQVRFIIAKKSLLARILEGDEKTKGLAKELSGMSAIVLSNEDPFELYKGFKSNSMKLGAKPNSVAPEDINIQAGETSIPPGQAVTELKQAGIDVQIQKGKVVIAKEKVLVKKGSLITTAVSRALKTLDIQPFTASIEPKVLLAGNLMFTREILSIDTQLVVSEIMKGFSSALTISLETKMVNQYTIIAYIAQSYREAMALGIEAKIPVPGVIERLVKSAAMQAATLGSMVKAEQPAQPQAQEPAPENKNST